ncbi:stalk domain-containing protein [Paenibacillus whitsoniae]|uniref:stalk domain-containing protein n=1 Tax=Paenibacillus whitsoniae TaxID=2496558 RepID=UPI0013E02D4C
MNYNGHAYVPVRFVAESLGFGIRYSGKDNVVSIMNEPSNVDEVTKKVWLVQYRITNGVDRNYVKGVLGEPSENEQLMIHNKRFGDMIYPQSMVINMMI